MNGKSFDYDYDYDHEHDLGPLGAADMLKTQEFEW